jgi:Uma2 family endonuclease
MSILIHDQAFADDLLARRRASGTDVYDEVWEGVYVMSPMANNEHQSLATEFAAAITTVIDWRGLGRTLAGGNVSDRRDDWTQNYRIPDVLVFLNETEAEDCGTHWFGGPNFAIEIVSPGDRTLDKLGFYAAVGTRELLVIDRDPWKMTLYQIDRAGKPTNEHTVAGSKRNLVPVAITRYCRKLCS